MNITWFSLRRPGQLSQFEIFSAAISSRFLVKAKVPDIRLYDLRHTCATLLLAAGENPKVVSERLGHASIVLTLDTYSHCFPTMQKSATERLQKLLGK